MITEQISGNGLSKLFLSIQKHCQSLYKRNVTFKIHVHSEFVANIELIVIGKKGTVEKNFVVIYDDFFMEWCVYSEGYKYRLTTLSEITSVLKQKISTLNSLVSKI